MDGSKEFWFIWDSAGTLCFFNEGESFSGRILEWEEGIVSRDSILKGNTLLWNRKHLDILAMSVAAMNSLRRPFPCLDKRTIQQNRFPKQNSRRVWSFLRSPYCSPPVCANPNSRGDFVRVSLLVEFMCLICNVFRIFPKTFYFF